MSNLDNYMDEVYKHLHLTNPKKFIDIINDRLQQYNISVYQMGKMLSFDKSTFVRLIRKIESGDIQKVDFHTILKITRFLGIGIDEISQLYISSLNPSAVVELEISKKANFLYRNFDLKGLKKIGFISNVYDVEAIELKLLSFFRLDSLVDYQAEVGAVLFSRAKRESHDKMREFWVRSAHFQFQKINNPNDFDKEKLLAIIPNIRPYTRFEEKGLLTVFKALYNIGVTVISQKYLAKTRVRGGTFVVDNKPCIVITDFNNSYATLWFALLHELYHVLYDFDELSTWIYHLTGEPDLSLLKEDVADYFAREMLFPTDKLNYIKHMISSPIVVQEYAKKNHVHPSIIYSFYCYEENKQGNNVYPFYQKYFGNPDKALDQIKSNPWNKQSIYDEIEIIKEKLETQIV